MVTQVLVLAIQNSVDRRDLGTATAGANFFRAMGGSVGVAVFGAIFANRLGYWLPRRVPVHLAGRFDLTGLLGSPAAIRALPAAVREGVMQAVAQSVHVVFLAATPMAVIGFVIALFLREHPLRTWGQTTGEKAGNAHSATEKATA
jgi:hypothetical protein